jgi:uncharacterized protein YceK
MMRRIWVLLWLVVALLAGCASGGDRGSALEKAQYGYSAAIRWGDFEGAWNMVDPAYRKAHPMTDLEFERYKQVQISSYHDLGSRVGDGVAEREIQIGVINRNTQVEREARYSERWRYDPEAKTWWIVGGLPDLWQ